MYSSSDLFRHARLVHVYASTIVFSLLILFAVTGLFLNHPGWFDVAPEAASTQGQIEGESASMLVNSDDADWQPDLDVLATYFRQRYGLGEPEYLGWDRNFEEASFDFSAPGGYARIYLNTSDGSYELVAENSGFIEVLNDLHKGRHSGQFWSAIIDLTSILVLVFAVTGLMLLLKSMRFRHLGFLLVVLGTAGPVFIYWLGVPRV